MSIPRCARNTPQIMVYNKIDKLEGWEPQTDPWSRTLTNTWGTYFQQPFSPITNHCHLVSIEFMCAGADFFRFWVLFTIGLLGWKKSPRIEETRRSERSWVSTDSKRRSQIQVDFIVFSQWVAWHHVYVYLYIYIYCRLWYSGQTASIGMNKSNEKDSSQHGHKFVNCKLLNDFEVFNSWLLGRQEWTSNCTYGEFIWCVVYYLLSMCHCKQSETGCMALSAEVEKPKNWNRVWELSRY